jgi:hypothetical protein
MVCAGVSLFEEIRKMLGSRRKDYEYYIIHLGRILVQLVDILARAEGAPYDFTVSRDVEALETRTDCGQHGDLHLNDICLVGDGPTVEVKLIDYGYSRVELDSGEVVSDVLEHDTDPYAR